MVDVEQVALELPLGTTIHKIAGTTIYVLTSTTPREVQVTPIAGRHFLPPQMIIFGVDGMAVLKPTLVTQLLPLLRSPFVFNLNITCTLGEKGQRRDQF